MRHLFTLLAVSLKNDEERCKCLGTRILLAENEPENSRSKSILTHLKDELARLPAGSLENVLDLDGIRVMLG